MAIVMNKVSEITVDGTRIVFGTVTPDNSFAAGGEAFDPKQFGIQSLLTIHFSSVAGYLLCWNGSTTSPKLLAYMGDNTNVANSPFIAADTKDLSALLPTFVAIGH